MQNETAEFEYQARKTQTLQLVDSINKNSRMSPDIRDEELFTKLTNLLNHAKKSSWWNWYLTERQTRNNAQTNLVDLSNSLPVLSRGQVQDFGQWMQIWVAGSKLRDYGKVTTSGSTGKPVTVTKFLPSQQMEYNAIELTDFTWQNIDLDRSFLVFTSRATPKVNPSPYGEPQNYLGGKGKTFFRKIEETKISDIFKLIVDENIESALFSPKVLRYLIAEFDESETPVFPLRNILAFSDRVENSDRLLARDILGARILDRYSTSELGPLAIQCPNREHLHALQFNNYVEILNSDNQPCVRGEIGRVVVTALSSFAMPLIRYETGDTASWDEACDSEITLPVLRPEIVRLRESYLGSDGAIRNVLPDNASFSKLPGIKDYQLFIFRDRLALFLIGNLVFTEVEIEAIKLELIDVTGKSLPAEVFVFDQLDWMQGWKRRPVVIVDENYPTGQPVAHFRRYL
jgi:phenylacetate-CoA ligase